MGDYDDIGIPYLELGSPLCSIGADNQSNSRVKVEHSHLPQRIINEVVIFYKG
jgi:hypothetical protein